MKKLQRLTFETLALTLMSRRAEITVWFTVNWA